MNDRTDKISKNSPRVFEFAEFSFDAAKKILWRGSETILLAPKACDLLAVLIENAPEVLSREELMNRVWNDSFVEEANLTHHISALRKALGEDKNGRKFIETIPRKGYRFVAPINDFTSNGAEIVISERTEIYAIENSVIETGAIQQIENKENLAVLRDSTTAPDLREKATDKRQISKNVYVFAVLILSGMILSAFFFGARLPFGKSGKTVVLPQAMVSKRLMPDTDTSLPTISPDGKFVVFSLLENGQSGVWQRNIQTGEMSQLSPALPLSENYSGRFIYSPDGAWIYFIRSNFKDRRTTLERMSAGGGNQQIILADIDKIRGDFKISPDGRFIAYLRNFDALMVVDIENKNERAAATRDGSVKAFGNPGNSAPAWSPDGRRIAVGGTSSENGQRKNQLIEINVETGAERIIPLSEDLRIYQIEWLADDSGLIVTAAEATGVPQQIRHISLPEGQITTLTNDDFGFNTIRLTNDSRTMLAEKDVGSMNIWTADSNDPNRRTQITKGGSALHGMESVAISANGQIVYSSPQNGSLDLWSVMSDGGGEPRQITKNTGKYNAVKNITPDGRYLVIDSIRSGNNQVWRVNADGGDPVQLSKTGQPAFNSELSADGKWAYFISSPAGQFAPQVYKVSIEGGEQVLANERNYRYSPRFSPDGKLLIFTCKDENNEPLPAVIIEAATGKVICPAEKLSRAAHGIWASDSRHLIYPHSFGQELWQFDINTGKDEKIADFRPATMYQFALSPDGKRYVFSLGSISGETVLFTNYLSETK